jgi:hypothetical protein
VVRAIARVVVVIAMVVPRVVVAGVRFLFTTRVLVRLSTICQLSVGIHLPFP